MVQAAIQVESLTREFKTLTAVDRVSFEVNTEEVYGFLVPNRGGDEPPGLHSGPNVVTILDIRKVSVSVER